MKILGVACERATYAGESRFSRSGPRQTTIRVDPGNPWSDWVSRRSCVSWFTWIVGLLFLPLLTQWATSEAEYYGSVLIRKIRGGSISYRSCVSWLTWNWTCDSSRFSRSGLHRAVGVARRARNLRRGDFHLRVDPRNPWWIDFSRSCVSWFTWIGRAIPPAPHGASYVRLGRHGRAFLLFGARASALAYIRNNDHAPAS